MHQSKRFDSSTRVMVGVVRRSLYFQPFEYIISHLLVPLESTTGSNIYNFATESSLSRFELNVPIIIDYRVECSTYPNERSSSFTGLYLNEPVAGNTRTLYELTTAVADRDVKTMIWIRRELTIGRLYSIITFSTIYLFHLSLLASSNEIRTTIVQERVIFRTNEQHCMIQRTLDETVCFDIENITFTKLGF